MGKTDKKHKTSKATKDDLDGAVKLVSDKDLDNARKTLQNKAEKKRLRENMGYYLKCKGLTDTYRSQSIGYRKEFLEKFAADRIMTMEGKYALEV